MPSAKENVARKIREAFYGWISGEELVSHYEASPNESRTFCFESVQGTNALVAATAARALGRFRDLARSSIPALRKALEHDHSGVRREAMNALKQIDPSAATTNEAR